MLKINSQRKVGAITIEVAIGIALAVIVLIIAIGLFNENLSNMLTGSNIKNMFLNGNKTTYGSFNRDYTDSQINVQIMGEQGLDMLRRIANNRAITQIEALYNGSDMTVKNNSSIGYLVLAINAIVGSPDICVFMKKDSNKECDQDNIGGYNYKVTSNGSGFTIRKVMNNSTPGTGNTTRSTYMSNGGEMAAVVIKVTTPANSSNSSATSNSSSPNGGGGTSGSAVKPASVGSTVPPLSPGYNPGSVNPKDIYQYIVDISTKSKPFVYPGVLLVNTSGDNLPAIKSAIKSLFTDPDPRKGLAASIQSAHDQCYDSLIGADASNGAPGCGDRYDSVYPGSDSYVSDNENHRMKRFTTGIVNQVNSAKTVEQLESLINSIINNEQLLFIIRNDNINDPKSCQLFTQVLQQIIDENNLNVGPPICVPFPQ